MIEISKKDTTTIAFNCEKINFDLSCYGFTLNELNFMLTVKL